ncbi:MAG: TIR domain-containing protein [Armatimonadetes bacterium]|nr:TIR domain-containing protein [Armatimonadota bacterium]
MDMSCDKLEEELIRRGFGRETVVHTVTHCIRQLCAQPARNSRPAVVFLFAGPTCSGKWELARELADVLYGSVARCVLFRMGQYATPDAACALVGSPGDHCSGWGIGQLVGVLREFRGCVLFFEEIEKAHQTALDILLQLADRGGVQDASGTWHDAREAVLVFSTNVVQEPRWPPEFLRSVDEVVRFQAHTGTAATDREPAMPPAAVWDGAGVPVGESPSSAELPGPGDMILQGQNTHALPCVEKAALPELDGQFAQVSLVSRSSRRCCLKAWDVASSQWVFIKMLSESGVCSRSAIEGFQSERRTVSILCDRIGPALIPPLLGSGIWRDRPYFVQQLVTGWALSSAMHRCPAFNVGQVLRVLEDCLAFLDRIHAAGFVHGDLSPENVFISTDTAMRTDGVLPEDFAALIVDFESSRRLRGPENGPGNTLIAKAPYLAPETASGSPLSVQSDIFALGVVAYELLVGRRPYDVRSLDDVRALSVGRPRAMPSAYAIPKLVEDLVRQMIQTAPSQRPGTAAEALERTRELRYLAECLQHSGPPAANADISHALARDTAHYVNTTTDREAESEILTRAVGDYICTDTRSPSDSLPQITGGAGVEDLVQFLRVSGSSDALGATGSSRHTASTEPPVRRETISSYLLVPMRDSEGQQQLVDFSLFSPSQIAAGSSFIIDVWAYPPPDRDEMLKRAARQRRNVEIGSRGGVNAPLNVGLSMSLELDRFSVDNPCETFWWSGRTANVGFYVTAPVNLPPATYAGRVIISHGGMLIVRLLFEITVGERNAASGQCNPGEVRKDHSRVRSAFASYSSKDRPLVVQRVQGMSAVGVDVFLDVLSIRAGQKWEDELLRNIRDRDVFYLFWSPNARNSKYVEREWRFALDQRGIDFIHPVPIADPQEAPPPVELSGLHFRDVYLMCLEQVSQKQV